MNNADKLDTGSPVERVAVLNIEPPLIGENIRLLELHAEEADVLSRRLAEFCITNSQGAAVGVTMLGAIKDRQRVAAKVRGRLIEEPERFTTEIKRFARVVEGKYRQARDFLKKELMRWQESQRAIEHSAIINETPVGIPGEQEGFSLPPPNVDNTRIRGEGGVCYERWYWVVEVADSKKLVKAAVSEKNTVVPMGVLTINQKELRRLVESEIVTPARWKSWGVVARKEMQLIHRDTGSTKSVADTPIPEQLSPVGYAGVLDDTE